MLSLTRNGSEISAPTFRPVVVSIRWTTEGRPADNAYAVVGASRRLGGGNRTDDRTRPRFRASVVDRPVTGSMRSTWLGTVFIVPAYTAPSGPKAKALTAGSGATTVTAPVAGSMR